MLTKEHYQQHGNDCVMLVKHLVNSESLSQPPFTFLPADFLGRIQEPLKVLPRNAIQDRAKKE